MRAQLLPLDGGSPIEILKDMTLVGRKEDCDVRLDHKSVSKLHCVIVRTDGLLLLRDLGSTNGTRVNGQRVRRAALLPNDKLTIAGYNFRVLFGAGVAPPISPEEHTQNIDAQEVANLIRQNGPIDANMDSEAEFQIPVQAQELPDVYPEEPKKNGR